MTIWESAPYILQPIAALHKTGRFLMSATASDDTMDVIIHIHNTETRVNSTRTVRAMDLLCIESEGAAEQLGGVMAREMYAEVSRARKAYTRRVK